MQVSVENTSSLGRRMTVEVPAEQVKSEEKQRIKNFASKAKISGFRPGKVPVDYIQKKYGPEIRQEAVTQVLQTSLGEALRDKNLRPANQPNVEELKDEANLVYTVTFEVYPEIELVDMSKVELEKITPEILEEDVDSGVSKLQDQFATWSEVTDRAAEKGDKITIDFVGSIDGEEFNGGTANGFDLELGSGHLIPGFEDGMLGASLDEERTLDLKFPEDYGNKDLAGKDVQFKVTVKKIQSKNEVPLDADFADKIGIEDKDPSKIRDKIKENMLKYVEDIIANKLREQALEKLYEANSFDVPDSLVDREQHNLMHEKYGKDAHAQSLSKEQLEQIAIDAKKRVAIGLLLNELISKNDLKPQKERVLAKLQSMANMYGATLDMLQKMYAENKDLQQNVANMALTDEAADFVVSGATIKEKTERFYDIVNDKA